VSIVRRLVAGVVLAAVAGCGQKASPKPPELVQPTAPSSLTATSTPGGIELTWRRPMRYSGGARMNDLDYFLVERAPSAGGPFGEVAQVAVTDRDRFRKQRRLTWTDASAEAGVHYYYRVTAVTLDDYESKPAGPIGLTFDPTAKPGEAPVAVDTTPEPPPVTDEGIEEDEDAGEEWAPGLGAAPGVLAPQPAAADEDQDDAAEAVDDNDTLDAADGVPTDDPDELPAD
jgi:hypothetical protein